jgi:aminopeptidase
MKDVRMVRLAEILTSYSVNVQEGDNVYLDMTDIPDEMTSLLIECVTQLGGKPFLRLNSTKVFRTYYRNATEEQIQLWSDTDLELMKKMDAYIAFRGQPNASEYSDVDPDTMAMIQKIRRPAIDERVNNTKWCVLRWPTPSMAQMAGMSTEAFEDFYFDICTFNYRKMGDAADSLVKRMEATDKVRVVSPNGTDLTFSIGNIPVIPCVGNYNVPDGEVFTAPVKDSVNGVIHYNAPTNYNDINFEDIRLVFENGKIVEATASDTEALNKILDTDDGSRFVGEFAIGFNPYITKPMGDILFDEKIAGSFHFTPGACYDDAPNGNKSNIHWDMVMIQTEEYGGGEIYFDDELIRKDGIFVVPDLLALNPENLK